MKNHNKNCIKPYCGKEKFIFISYSHKDIEEVMKVVACMSYYGYRVWYDEGIDPGTEWDNNIASHIDECGYFIAFISKNYILSDNCKDELNYARDLKKKRLLVYLEDAKLPSGLAMRLNRLQAIHKYKYDNDEQFMDKLGEADGIDGFCDNKVKSEKSESRKNYSYRQQIKDCCTGFCEHDKDNAFVFLTITDFQYKKEILELMTEKLGSDNKSFIYVGMESFMNNMIGCIRNGQSLEAFRNEYAAVPLLIIDDAEMIAGKSSTQEELFLLLKKRFFESMPTMVIFQDIPDKSRFDKRLTELLSQWKNFTVNSSLQKI